MSCITITVRCNFWPSYVGITLRPYIRIYITLRPYLRIYITLRPYLRIYITLRPYKHIYITLRPYIYYTSVSPPAPGVAILRP